MLVTGFIRNSDGAAVPFASVAVLDSNFAPTGEGTAAQQSGYFALDVNTNNEPYALAISSVGYKSQSVALSGWYNGRVITLQTVFTTGENVVVTSTPRPTDTEKHFPLWLLAFPLLAWVVNDEKKRSISGINVKRIYSGLPSWARGAVVVGGAVVGYTVLNRLLKKEPEKQEPNAAGDKLAQLAQMGIYPNYSRAQLESFSNAIVQAIWDCGTDETAIYNVMRAMKNEADIYSLINVYGVREYKGCFENFFGLVSRSLSGAISSELDAGEKRKVNEILRGNGITFQFA